ncbi:unnamed protein product [Prorocentrum cordatum]|uniref:Pentatricopeptide repeat-containing protein, chloroplastic n=1 Tax=Prorocentrum cordatum TaxID=2364126 RepID=A0ABN9WCP5_9DINO|nr:unnamed protein product [Polarella glacialis]
MFGVRRGYREGAVSLEVATKVDGQAKQWRAAVQLLRERIQSGTELSPGHYMAAVSACRRGGQWRLALSLLSEMWESNMEPDIISCSAGISACEKGGQWQRALAMLNEMREAELDPNVIHTSATTLGSVRARRATSGNVLWRCSARCGRRSWSPTCSQLQRWGQRVRERRAVGASSGAADRDAGGEAGTQRHLQLQRWDQRVRERRAVAARSVAAQRDAGGGAGNRFSYSAGISACEKGDQWQCVLALLSEMRETKLQPDAMSFSAGISACGKGEQWQRALALLNGMRKAKVGPHSDTTLASAHTRLASSGSGLWRCSARRGRRSWNPTPSATALGSARARRANNGSGRWRCSARCGRRRWIPTSSATTLWSVRAGAASSGCGL